MQEIEFRANAEFHVDIKADSAPAAFALLLDYSIRFKAEPFPHDIWRVSISDTAPAQLRRDLLFLANS